MEPEGGTPGRARDAKTPDSHRHHGFFGTGFFHGARHVNEDAEGKALAPAGHQAESFDPPRPSMMQAIHGALHRERGSSHGGNGAADAGVQFEPAVEEVRSKSPAAKRRARADDEDGRAAAAGANDENALGPGGGVGAPFGGGGAPWPAGRAMKVMPR